MERKQISRVKLKFDKSHKLSTKLPEMNRSSLEWARKGQLPLEKSYGWVHTEEVDWTTTPV